jgi:predicted regulator of Ras-like GTPase activity (Roadblock/LC7/MglB family)
VDAAQALAELREISSQIDVAVILDDKGEVVGSTHGNPEALAGAARTLLEEAKRVRPEKEAAQIEVGTAEGSVFVYREGTRTIAATTGPEPTVGLVFYDLKSCLRSIEEKPKRKRAPRKKKTEADAS